MPQPYRGLSGTINDEQSRPLKGSQFLDTAEQKLSQGISYLKDASKDREGIGDDLLRLAGGGLKNIGHVTNAPVIKQGLQIAGAIPWAAGQAIGAGLEHGLGIDPRYGHIAGELGDLAVGGGALKIGSKLARKGARRLGQYGDAFYGLASGTAMGTGAHGAAGGVLRINKNYTRADAVENLLKIGAKRKLGKTIGERTLQGPLPNKLSDKTFKQGARSAEEALMKGTTKFIDEAGDYWQIRNYASSHAPYGKTTKVGTRKTSGRGITKEGNTRKLNEALATADWISPEDTKLYGKIMAEAAAEGMDGDHIVDIARIANGVRHKSPAERIAFFKTFENAGVYLGNHPKNIQKLSKEVNQVIKPAEIRAIDNAIRKMDKRSKTLLEEMLFSGKKAKPTQWSDFRARNIKRDVELFGQAEWKVGDAKVTWYPNKNNPLKGRGQIDILEQAGKTNPKGVKALIKDFNDSLKDFPSGVQVELNPKWKDAKRRSIYENYVFKNHPNIKRNADPTLGWVYTAP